MTYGYQRVGTTADGLVTVGREVDTHSFYGADDRLRAFQKWDVRRTGDETHEDAGVWEEYRYDPLGRRVLVRTRTDRGLCNYEAWACTPSATTFVWAGDQLLWELKSASGAAGGNVGYFHAGGGIDRPLVITKGATSIVPHQNWRGQFARGTYADGANVGARSDCTSYPASGCVPIQWPGERTTARHELEPQGEIRNWFGSLVDDMRDATGQMYKRNRYYDPQTGQFTQPDPIGIAGGLNEYGFAEGDPVSYDDPYGLCAAHLVQVPVDGDEPERVCPGNLTHGEYYRREDGSSVMLSGSSLARASVTRFPQITLINDSEYPLAVVLPGLVGCPVTYEGYAQFPLPGRPHNPFFDLRRRGDVENKRSGSYGYYQGEMWDTGRWSEPVHGTAWCRIGLIILHYSHGNVH